MTMDPDPEHDLKARIDALRSEGVLAVTCPTCGGEASFHRAFGWLTGEEAERAKADPEILGVSESGGFVVELYPEVFLWSDPERAAGTSSSGHRVGVLRCTACRHHAKHRLRWPDDLYYRVRVAGVELVAYTREHAEDQLALLEQVQAIPTLLRPFLRVEFESRMPAAFMQTERLEPAVVALRRLLGITREDD